MGIVVEEELTAGFATCAIGELGFDDCLFSCGMLDGTVVFEGDPTKADVMAAIHC